MASDRERNRFGGSMGSTGSTQKNPTASNHGRQVWRFLPTADLLTLDDYDVFHVTPQKQGDHDKFRNQWTGNWNWKRFASHKNKLSPTSCFMKTWQPNLQHFLTCFAVMAQRRLSSSWQRRAFDRLKIGTPWKINMEPTNHLFRKKHDLPNLHEYVPC